MRFQALVGISMASLLVWPGGISPTVGTAMVWSGGPPQAPAGDVPGSVDSPQEAGAALFRSNCAGCHTLGGGDGMGPDLLGVEERRDEAWLRAWIASPGALAETDPEARALVERWGFVMPDLGLDGDEVDAVLTYLRSVSSGDATPAAGPHAGMGRGGGGHRGHRVGRGHGGRHGKGHGMAGRRRSG